MSPLDALFVRDAPTVSGADPALALGALPTSEHPIDDAISGGARADRIAWAFLAGYAAACRRLVGSRARAAALAVTEAEGNSPRVIRTTLEDGALRGEKRFVTMGPLAEELLVLARTGTRDDGRPELALTRVKSDAPGVTLTTLPPLPFVPELPHAVVTFEGASAERLPGDGWSDFVKPFRTIEDIHVTAAVLAFLGASRARASLPVDPVLAPLVALRGLADDDPTSPAVHLTLAATLRATHAAVDEVRPDVGSEAVLRDLALLGVAGKARAERERVARERLGAGA